jgi:hypothetical protein
MPTDAEWLEVKFVTAKKRLFGPRELRIAFRHVFPYDSFKALVYGPDAASYVAPPDNNLPLSSEERDWW